MFDVSYADVIRTVNRILKEMYPKITRYGNDTVDKAVPPYFFVECVPAGVNRQTRNMLHKTCSVLITYVQRVPDQLDNLTKADEIENRLGMLLPIGGRQLRGAQVFARIHWGYEQYFADILWTGLVGEHPETGDRRKNGIICIPN